MSVLLVEQNANLAIGIAHRARQSPETGRVILHGTAENLRNDDAVRRILHRELMWLPCRSSSSSSPRMSSRQLVVAGLSTGSVCGRCSRSDCKLSTGRRASQPGCRRRWPCSRRITSPGPSCTGSRTGRCLSSSPTLRR